MNLIGQLRIYSLVDLVLLLVASHATTEQFVGSVCLWIGFLLFLEANHRHSYRARFPKGSWAILWGIGLWFFHSTEIFILILLGILYTQKNKGSFAAISPIVRGLQSLVLVGGIMGFDHSLPWIAGALTAFRNFLGDLRDVEKDEAEGKMTIPVFLSPGQLPPFIRNIHLYGCWLTSSVWWMFSGLSIWWILITWIIQKKSYHWTAR